MLIMNEGALFRGPARGLPKEVWAPQAKRWQPYEGSVPKPISWGDEISEAEASKIMGEPYRKAAAAE